MPSLEIKAVSCPIPFRTRFGHASAERASAENIIVLVKDRSGLFGLGEGCPRSYVTGETVASALVFVEAHRDAFTRLEDFYDLKAWMATHEVEIDANPSAFCAVELALLDLFGRRAQKPLEAFLGIPRAFSIRASAVYGTSGGLKFKAQRLLFEMNGLHDAKLKVSGDLQRDVARVRALSRSGAVRLDANNLWPDAASAIAALNKLAAFAWAVEEPIKPRDWAGLRAISEATGLLIIADESLTRLADLSAMPEGFAVNLRVSKLGGLLRSRAVLDRARAQNRPIIIGAQVGETSILARAALSLAAAANGDLRGFEAGYGTWLLTQDIVSPELRIAHGGLRPDPIVSAYGMGLTLTAHAGAFGLS